MWGTYCNAIYSNIDGPSDYAIPFETALPLVSICFLVYPQSFLSKVQIQLTFWFSQPISVRKILQSWLFLCDGYWGADTYTLGNVCISKYPVWSLGTLLVQVIVSNCPGLTELIYWITKHLQSTYYVFSTVQGTGDKTRDCCCLFPDSITCTQNDFK